MKRQFLWLTFLLTFVIAGCASTQQTAPCPDYGTSCVKKPINSWDNGQD